MPDRRRFSVAVILLMLLTAAAPAWAWHHEGHELIAAAAVRALPAGVPAFFREGAEAVARTSIDPDLFRDRSLPQLRAAEPPDHYFSSEDFVGVNLPTTRPGFYAMLHRMKIEPRDAGTLPYAVTEWQQRLTLAFALYRRSPDNRAVRMQCLVFAGMMSHYSGDLVQPLHTTIHFNGRVTPQNPHPRSDIHTRVDDVLRRLAPEEARPTDPIDPLPRVFDAVVAKIRQTNTMVDDVYTMERDFPVYTAPGPLPPDVHRWAAERARAGATFTAQLILTAWRDSASVKLPHYLDRTIPAPASPSP